MLTGVQEEITYCSPSTSSGKQKKTRSTSQPQFHTDNTPATIEADQILLALHQLQATTILQFFITILTEFQVAKVAHHNDAHFWREIWEN